MRAPGSAKDGDDCTVLPGRRCRAVAMLPIATQGATSAQERTMRRTGIAVCAALLLLVTVNTLGPLT
jgi:hypothetical protein